MLAACPRSMADAEADQSGGGHRQDRPVLRHEPCAEQPDQPETFPRERRGDGVRDLPRPGQQRHPGPDAEAGQEPGERAAAAVGTCGHGGPPRRRGRAAHATSLLTGGSRDVLPETCASESFRRGRAVRPGAPRARVPGGPPAPPSSRPGSPRSGAKPRSRRLLVTTKTELNAIAAPGDHRVEQPGGGQRDRGHVVGEGPEQVALDRGQRAARQPDRVGGHPQVAADEREVTGLDRDVGAGAHGQAQVGLRERRGVVDAVPDHGDRPALVLQPADDVHLVARQHLGDHLLDPDLGRHRPRHGLVVAGQQDRGEPEVAQLTDGVRRRRLDRVGHHQDPAGRAVPPDGDGGPPGGLRVGRGPLQLGGQRLRPLGEQPAAADDDGVPVDDAGHPEPLDVGEVGDRRAGPRPARRRRGPPPARSGAPRPPPAHRPAGAPHRRPRRRAGTTSSRVIRPVVTVPVLSRTTVSTRRVFSSTSGPLMRMPSCAPAAGADHEGGRRGQPQRAGAGDDQDGDRRGERRRQAGARADPEAEGRDGERQHDRHEDPGDAVGQPLHLGLAVLRLLDQPRHLGELRLRADVGGPHDQPAAGVDRGAGDRVARPHLHRYGLAGQHRGVDGRRAVGDHAVRGDLLAGADDELLAHGQVADRDEPLHPAAEDRHLLGAELQQRPQRGAGLPLGAGLEVPAGEDERRHPGGGLEVDVRAAVGPGDRQLERMGHARLAGGAQEERVERPAEGGQRAQGDEGVHRRGAVPQVGPGRAVERRAAPHHDGRGQRQRQPLPEVELQRRDHRHGHDRHGQGGGDQQPGAQRPRGIRRGRLLRRGPAGGARRCSRSSPRWRSGRRS